MARSKKQSNKKRLWLPLIAAGALLAILCLWTFRQYESATLSPTSATIVSIQRILTEDVNVVTNEIALLNLACADGLPGTQDLDIGQCLRTLEEMASHVREETARHHYRYRQNPAEFENSEGFFRMLMLAVVLAEDFKITYDPARKAGAMAGSEHDGFFADASSVFLHGLLGPKRQGTCSSMPVLYVAIGRRLGYPLKLVTTKGHLFVRWDGDRERFNVEATSHGLNRFQDDYYRHWAS